MATVQRARSKKTKVIPTSDDLERPSSALSNKSWVEDFDGQNGTAEEKSGALNSAYQVTEVEDLPQGPLTSDLKGGSMLSVREAENGDRVDLTDEELNFKDEVGSIADSLARSGSPYSLVGSADGDGRKKRRRLRKERANAVTPVLDDPANDRSLSLSEEKTPNKLKRKGPSEAWSMSSMQDVREIPLDTPPASGVARSHSPQPRHRSPGVGTHSATASRAQSVISVREANKDQRMDGLEGTGEESGSKTKEERNSEDNRSVVSARSLLPPPQLQLEQEQQAYVPYVYARDCLAKVMADMGQMKANHLRIVGQIQDTYSAIEDETQGQFNMFVGGLRIQYKDKVKTFRQVIEIHQEDFGSHKIYWEETLKSLSARNKALMKEKKKLLIINKMEIDRLEKEKEDLTHDLTNKLDQNQSSFVSRQKNIEGEKKIMEDRLETEKQSHQEEVERLRRELEEAREAAERTPEAPLKFEEASVSSALVRASRASLRSEGRGGSAGGGGRGGGGGVVLAAAAGVAAGGGMSEEERRRAEEARGQMEEKMIQSQKDLVVLQTKYDFLLAQYTTLASLAKQDSEGALTGQLDSAQKDLEIMEEESSELREEIQQWEADFKEQTGREPTAEDRSETVRELETQLTEAEDKKAELDSKVVTLVALKEGRTPDTQPASIPEPVVKTVEITVADPATVAALAAAQQRSDELEERLRQTESDLRARDKRMKALEKERKKAEKAERRAADSGTKEDKQNLKLLLEAVVLQSAKQETSGDDPSAKLDEAKAEKESLVAQRDKAKQDLESWVEKFQQENGSYPEESDRDTEATALFAALDESNTKCLSNETEITALSMLATGQVPSDLKPMREAQVTLQATGSSADAGQLEELEDRIRELEEENERLSERASQQEETVRELESRLAEMEAGGGHSATAAALASLDIDDDDVEGFGAQLAALHQQVDGAERQLRQERASHDTTREELETARAELDGLRQEKRILEEEVEGKIAAATVAIAAEMRLKEKSLEETKQRLDELETEKLKNLPPDAAKEIAALQALVKKAEKEKEEAQVTSIGGTADLDKLRTELKTSNQALSKERETNRSHHDNLKKKLAEKDKQSREQVAGTEKKYLQRESDLKKQIQTLEKRNKELAAGGGGARAAVGAKGAADAKSERKIKLLTEQAATLKKTIQENQDKMRQMEKDMKEAKSGGSADKQAGKKMEKQLKELEKKLETEQKKFEREKKNATELDAELKTTTKELDGAKDEIKKLSNQINSLGVAAAEALELKEKVTEQEAELKRMQSELKTLTENYNSERVLRKKYYNMVEDMKGKIRVYCRTRPLSTTEKGRGNFSIIKAPDEYSIEVKSNRGLKEFQFDHIFMPESSQADVFEDTNNLIQSSVDGYNVCIFAYGQTGSGKTFTMIGDKEGNFPGVAPRAFQKIFDVIEENKNKFSFRVESYMLELYNDKLIDLYSKSHGDSAKLDIKKDKKGLVFVHGSVVQEASNAKELYGLFEQGSSSRHVASTKMNAESSRSHLIIGVVIESTNLATGAVTRGKLSLVDLAGSERAAKTDATAQQLKEANSINKSLSALGDVISALSSEQSFIPYRNNKLTMLMQDSLGGNAKTLMFVNISPADYNAEETVISLTYASRVKLITNDASKNADNKEIARLKEVIAKLKKGEDVEGEESEV